MRGVWSALAPEVNAEPPIFGSDCGCEFHEAKVSEDVEFACEAAL